MRRALVVAVCLAIAASSLPAEESGWQRDLRDLREGGPGTKAAAAARLATCRDPAALTEILAVLDDSDLRTRVHLRQAVLAIGALVDARTALDAVTGAPPKARETAALLLADELAVGRKELLAERLRTSSATVLGDLLARTGREDAVDLLLEVLPDPDVEVRLRVIAALGSCAKHAAKIVPHLKKRLWSAEAKEAEELLWAGVRLPGPESRHWLVCSALDGRLEVLAAVIDPAYRTDVLLALVDLLPRSHPAMVRLIGKDLGGFPEDWKKHVGRISPPEKPRRGSAPPPAPDPEEDPGRMFYGVPLPRGDFVFLLDASASMNREVEGVKMIDRVVRRVRELLDEMRDGQKFNIVFFNAVTRTHRRRMVARSDEEARIAGRFLNKIRAEGPTNLGAGLRAALRDPAVREIILLSDGRPTRGRFRWASDVVRLLGERRVRIHCVGTRDSSRLLRNIARETGGHYGEF